MKKIILSLVILSSLVGCSNMTNREKSALGGAAYSNYEETGSVTGN